MPQNGPTVNRCPVCTGAPYPWNCENCHPVPPRAEVLAVLRRYPQTAYESAIKDQLKRAADFLESTRVRWPE